MVRFDTPEGATPIEDASGLLVEGVVTYADLSEKETENIIRAVDEHLRLRKRRMDVWLTEDYVRLVHRDMFDRVWEWAGRYRDAELNIGVAASRVREEIAKLCQDVAFWDGQKENPLPVLERAVRLHHRLAWIHPFPNGNGRHARLMSDIYLRVYRHKLPDWPSSALGGPGDLRAAYLDALRKADSGDFGSLVEYTKRFLPTAK
ncbi:MAG: mobile mystery protein B [Elusimicrobia bacterium]|nr:mobile mystery protein B [Elusimicrobiota bacterium]